MIADANIDELRQKVIESLRSGQMKISSVNFYNDRFYSNTVFKSDCSHLMELVRAVSYQVDMSYMAAVFCGKSGRVFALYEETLKELTVWPKDASDEFLQTWVETIMDHWPDKKYHKPALR